MILKFLLNVPHTNHNVKLDKSVNLFLVKLINCKNNPEINDPYPK